MVVLIEENVQTATESEEKAEIAPTNVSCDVNLNINISGKLNTSYINILGKMYPLNINLSDKLYLLNISVFKCLIF